MASPQTGWGHCWSYRLRATEPPPRVMVGNPIIETSAQNVDAAGVPVLGYGESAYR